MPCARWFPTALILAILFHLVGVVEAKVGTRELGRAQWSDEPDSGVAPDQCNAGVGGHGQRWYPWAGGFCHGVSGVSGQLCQLSHPDSAVA